MLGMLLAFWWAWSSARGYRRVLRAEIIMRFSELQIHSDRLLKINKPCWLRLFLPWVTDKKIRKESKESLYYRHKGWLENQRNEMLMKHGLEGCS
jgi:hypothetical protein